MVELTASSDRIPFRDILSTRQRWQYHGLVAITVLFLTIYATIVCPFIDTLPVRQVFIVLGLIGIGHIIFREVLSYVFLPRYLSQRANRTYQLYSLTTWIMAGIAATLVHAVLYPNFPIASHLKLLVGYWALGGGFITLLETRLFTNSIRNNTNFHLAPSRFSHQFVMLFSIMILIPSLVLVLVIFRFADEGFIDIGAGYEIIFLTSIFTITGILVCYHYGRQLHRDTARLIGSLRKVASGNFNVSVDSTRPDELGYVARQINRMVKQLARKERIEKAFGKFVNPWVAEQFLQDQMQHKGDVRSHCQRIKAVVLMGDIRGFTTISENMRPESVTEMLNLYFKSIVPIINRNHGIVDKFIGDAVMAVFGLVESKNNGAENKGNIAVRQAYDAGFAMIQEVTSLNLKLQKLGLPALKIGIGIHYGEVVASYLGSPERLEYTVVGKNVNMASRIEGIAREPNPPLLLSEPAAAELSDSSDAPVFVLTSDLKGFTSSVKLYSHPEFARLNNITTEQLATVQP